MFGWFRRKRPAEVLLVVDEQADRENRAEMFAIQKALKFSGGGGSGDWLRLHQVLKDHEDRIAKLEGH